MNTRTTTHFIRTAAAGAALLTGLAAHAQDKPVHWSYGGDAGPARWAELAPDFATCKMGGQQSPINIETKAVQKMGQSRPIGFSYASSDAEVVNNGHTIQVNLMTAGGITMDGGDYKLLQFHFHTPSEEQFDGKPYPMVAHLVHRNAEGKLAVVAVLFKQGKENAALKPVFTAMPAEEGAKARLDGGFDVAKLLPAHRSYYAFSGSLTTPPCSEEVSWRVLRTPVEMSAAQLKQFRTLYARNARPVQPLNGRTVEMGE